MSVYNSINNHSDMKFSVNKNVVIKYNTFLVIEKNVKGLLIDPQSGRFGDEMNTV